MKSLLILFQERNQNQLSDSPIALINIGILFLWVYSIFYLAYLTKLQCAAVSLRKLISKEMPFNHQTKRKAIFLIGFIFNYSLITFLHLISHGNMQFPSISVKMKASKWPIHVWHTENLTQLSESISQVSCNRIGVTQLYAPRVYHYLQPHIKQRKQIRMRLDKDYAIAISGTFQSSANRCMGHIKFGSNIGSGLSMGLGADGTLTLNQQNLNHYFSPLYSQTQQKLQDQGTVFVQNHSRRFHGACKGIRGDYIDGGIDAEQRECQALKEAVIWAHNLKFTKVIFESDNLNLVNTVNNINTSVSWTNQGIVLEIRHLLNNFASWKCSHVDRTKNVMADNIAKEARKRKECFLYCNDIPADTINSLRDTFL